LRQTLSLSFLIVGTVVGAGFASGKEIAVYFSPMGWAAIGAAVLLAALFSWGFTRFFSFSRTIGAGGLSVAALVLMPKRPRVLSVLLGVNNAIVLASMLSAAAALLPGLGIATAVLTYFAVFFGLKSLSKINAVLVPVILFMIVTAAVFGLGRPAAPPPVAPAGAGLAALNLPLYVSMNLGLAAGVLFSVAPDRRTARRASLLASVLLGACILLLALAVYLQNKTDTDMPVLALLPQGRWIYAARFAVWAGIFTTVISVTFSLDTAAARLLPRKAARLFLLVAGGYCLSLVGFSRIVVYFYPLSGGIGLVLVLAVVLHGKKMQNA
jgi:uncharacterized membrane protein YkvI